MRPAKGRTPASSASYHMFALFMDGGLVPFYIFIALFANNAYNTPVNASSRWTSFFNNANSTAILLSVTWIAAAVMAGLHLVSIGIDIYLVMMFRKIAKLPPDMNPLEDNLTSRRAAKHQYKNSEASISTASMSQKPPGYTSRSTLNLNDNRSSKAFTVDERAVPFRHSRMGSDQAFSPHNPESARYSRQQFDQQSMYQQAQSMRGSRQSFASHARGDSMSPSKRGSFVQPQDSTLPPLPMDQERFNSPRPMSFVSARSQPDSPERLYTARSTAPSHAAVQSGQKQSLLNDNWYVSDEPGHPEIDMMSPPRSPATPSRVPNFSRPSPEPSPSPEYQRQPRLPKLLPERDLTSGEIEAFTPQPLRMNPPTPPIEQQDRDRIFSKDSFQVVQAAANQENQRPLPDPADFAHHDDDETATLTGKQTNEAERQPLNDVAVNRSLTAASQATVKTSSSVYSDSAESLGTARKNAVDAYADANSPGITSAGTPRGKYYGDLAGAMRGIRNQASGYSQLPKVPSPERYGAPSPPKHGGNYGGGRVVSRTGADIADADLYLPEKSSRRRMVSGKDAEEGLMGGNRW